MDTYLQANSALSLSKKVPICFSFKKCVKGELKDWSKRWEKLKTAHHQQLRDYQTEISRDTLKPAAQSAGEGAVPGTGGNMTANKEGVGGICAEPHCHLPILFLHGCVWLKFHTAAMSRP